MLLFEFETAAIKLLNELKAANYLAEEYFQVALTYSAMGDTAQADKYRDMAIEIYTNEVIAKEQIGRINSALDKSPNTEKSGSK